MNRPGTCKPSNILYCLLVFSLLFFAVSPRLFTAGDKKQGKDQGLNATYRIVAEKMQEAYESGELHRVVDLYNTNCCRPGDTAGKWKPRKEKKEFKKVKKDIRADIYHSLALSLIALDRPGTGEIYIRKILVLRRDEGTGKYWLSIRQTAKNNYVVAPRVLVGIKLGTNFTFIDPGERFMVLEPVQSSRRTDYFKDYGSFSSHSQGTHFGLYLEYALNQNLSITLQPAFSTVNFQYKNTFLRQKEVLDDITLNYTHNHELGYLEIPVLLTWHPVNGKLKPYFHAGGYYSLLQFGEKSLHAVSLPDRDYEEDAIVRVSDQFVTSNFGIWIGAGLSYKLNRGGVRLQAEVNYRHGLNNITDKARRFENKELMFSYYDVFDDMKLRNWELTLKLVLPVSFKAFRR